jgi:hypothetical protein
MVSLHMFYSNPAGWRGKCGIYPPAKQKKKKQTGNVAIAQNGCAKTTLSRQFK